MTDAQALCGFKPPKKFHDPDYQCRHPARQDNLCLFHLFKPTEEQKQAMAQEARKGVLKAAEETEEGFRQAFSKLLEDEEKNQETEFCDFRYFHFPAIDLRRQFAKPLRLRGATFSGEAGFWDATFNRKAGFGKAIFRGEADFRRVAFSGRASLQEATFNEKADFEEVTFNGEAYLWRATFNGKAIFEEVTFSGETSLRGETWDLILA